MIGLPSLSSIHQVDINRPQKTLWSGKVLSDKEIMTLMKKARLGAGFTQDCESVNDHD